MVRSSAGASVHISTTVDLNKKRVPEGTKNKKSLT